MTVVTSYEFSTHPDARLSDAEREHAIEVLRESAVEGRLSHDTFLQRMELALVVRGRDELEALTADLPPAEEGRLTRFVVRAVGKVSALHMRIRNAWRVERLPTLVLPVADSEPMPLPLRIGRDLSSGLRLSDSSASRVHAELRRDGETWTLRDLGSMNGTFVNGRRVMGAVVVRPGDQVTFGRMSYRLAAGQA
ncbi:FHA domain-containing protein [Actinacidiphila oryziradicis]|uniref:FHA domain-containing protein n=1 Tax=Actinacidiphila oryziradicis TaxID=2571141 RepID=A0A4U0RV48_9ACTN|nr:DUF1707 and FHA domain-containing protein [Actinacidiphila oryziradicis]TJZ99366.1 FHA domain-containing protein [Actinacidiphila oryziradicis]